ncbi:MAG: NucA/NucB deoxyribonuclease domain-containing protein [Terracidiphilus sp.]|nr:NucA/NucB deoxyribonuclease domain-containing protein [Terracidiphilus sp.]
MPDIPVLIFDWKELPNIADNIWNAQMAGWERVLTYRGPLPDPESRGIRRQTMSYEVDSKGYRIPTTANEERDEYPFACTVEGAARSGDRKPWVGHVPSHENHVQGSRIGAFIRQHNITAGGPNRKFEVRIINHPRGPVVR